MEFIWPGTTREADHINVGKKFEKVDKMKESLLESLTISPQKIKEPIDLLTVYAMYEIFSIKGEKGEEARERFLERFKNRLVYYLENKNSIPDYRSFVRKLFKDLLDVKLKKEIEQMDLDAYFIDNKDLKSFINILGGFRAESWSEFKENFIKKCRDLYPYAEKRLDRMWNSKNFKKEITELFLKEKKEEYLSVLSDFIEDQWKVINESREEGIKMLEDQISKGGDTEKLSTTLDLLKNGDGKIFVEMKWMIKLLSVFDIECFNIEELFLKFYVKKVKNRFKDSSDKRNPNNIVSNQSQSDVENGLVSYIEESPKFFGESARKISVENEKLIDSIVKTYGFDEKKSKSLKKYLVRLLSNGRECRMSSLKNLFGIEKLDVIAQNCFDNLGIVVRNDIFEEKDEEDLKSEQVENESNDECGVIEDVDDKVEEGKEIDTCDSSLNPVDVCLKQVNKYHYIINNEKKLIKQIEDLCKTDDELEQIFCVEMQKDSFGTPKKKHGKSYYTIEVGVTGIRFLLFKCKNGRFLIDGVYNHDDYRKRVKEMK